MFNWGRRVHSNCGWCHSPGWVSGLNKKESQLCTCWTPADHLLCAYWPPADQLLTTCCAPAGHLLTNCWPPACITSLSASWLQIQVTSCLPRTNYTLELWAKITPFWRCFCQVIFHSKHKGKWYTRSMGCGMLIPGHRWLSSLTPQTLEPGSSEFGLLEAGWEFSLA